MWQRVRVIVRCIFLFIYMLSNISLCFNPSTKSTSSTSASTGSPPVSSCTTATSAVSTPHIELLKIICKCICINLHTIRAYTCNVPKTTTLVALWNSLILIASIQGINCYFAQVTPSFCTQNLSHNIFQGKIVFLHAEMIIDFRCAFFDAAQIMRNLLRLL